MKTMGVNKFHGKQSFDPKSFHGTYGIFSKRIMDIHIFDIQLETHIYIYIDFIKGSLDEKLPIYERDPKSKIL